MDVSMDIHIHGKPGIFSLQFLLHGISLLHDL